MEGTNRVCKGMDKHGYIRNEVAKQTIITVKQEENRVRFICS